MLVSLTLRRNVIYICIVLCLFVVFPLSLVFAGPAATVTSPFLYTFNSPGTLMVANSMEQSSSPYFWVSSGARLIIKDGFGETLQGPLVATDTQRLLYNSVNSLDTDSGYYPQNTFRLVSRSVWGDAETSIKFDIVKTNLTNTPNRDGYSGIFLMGRYIDQNNLYYVGIRQDGGAIIKKKIGSEYYTLAYKQLFGVAGAYSTSTNPNLIPQNKWMGLKERITNQPDGSVKIEMLFDANNTNIWLPILTATDTAIGGPAFTAAGYGGLRTDYMDVFFDNFEFRTVAAVNISTSTPPVASTTPGTSSSPPFSGSATSTSTTTPVSIATSTAATGTSTSTQSAGPLLSFNFDDGFESAYLLAHPIVQAAGFKTSQYIITGKMDNPGYITREQVLALQAAGDEIGVHTRTHPYLTQLSLVQDMWEIKGAKQDLLDLGIATTTTFAYPYGNYSPAVEDAVKSAGFFGARTTKPGLNDNSTDPFQLFYVGMNASSTLSGTMHAIDDAIAKKKWIILVFHRVNETGYENVSDAFVKQVVDYVKQKNIPVVTTAQGLTMLTRIPH